MSYFKEFSYIENTKVRIIDNGKVEMTCVDDAKGVTPKMILWYMLNRTKERYKMWHPTHIDFEVLSEPIDRAVGSIYHIVEQATGGPMVDAIVEVLEASIISDDQTIILERFRQRSFPMTIYHRMEAMPGGTRVYSNLTVGSDIPVFGRIHNAILRRKMRISTPDGYKVWFNHVSDEGKNYAKFLPKLFEKECTDPKWKEK